MYKILIADLSPYRIVLKEIFTENGYSAVFCDSAFDAISKLKAYDFDHSIRSPVFASTLIIIPRIVLSIIEKSSREKKDTHTWFARINPIILKRRPEK